MRSIVANCVGLFFWIRKRNIVGEFGRIFETVVGVEIGSKKVSAL